MGELQGQTGATAEEADRSSQASSRGVWGGSECGGESAAGDRFEWGGCEAVAGQASRKSGGECERDESAGEETSSRANGSGGNTAKEKWFKIEELEARGTLRGLGWKHVAAQGRGKVAAEETASGDQSGGSTVDSSGGHGVWVLV